MISSLILCAMLGADVELTAHEGRMLVNINSERQSRGLSELTVDEALMNATRGHCEWMATNSKMVHARNCGRENIAMGTTVDGCHQMWMKSTGHRNNILYHGGTKIGVAAYTNSRGRTYYCYRVY
jgi:uncharacterized protein YkwD